MASSGGAISPYLLGWRTYPARGTSGTRGTSRGAARSASNSRGHPHHHQRGAVAGAPDCRRQTLRRLNYFKYLDLDGGPLRLRAEPRTSFGV